jgi:hypothetical protein
LCAIVDGKLFQQDDAVDDRMQLQVGVPGREVVQENEGAMSLREEMFQRQDLAAIPQGVLSEETKLRQAVDNDAGRIESDDLVEDQLRRLAQLDLGRMQDRKLAIRIQCGFGGNEHEYIDPTSDQPCRFATSRNSVSVSDKAM